MLENAPLIRYVGRMRINLIWLLVFRVVLSQKHRAKKGILDLIEEHWLTMSSVFLRN